MFTKRRFIDENYSSLSNWPPCRNSAFSYGKNQQCINNDWQNKLRRAFIAGFAKLGTRHFDDAAPFSFLPSTRRFSRTEAQRALASACARVLWSHLQNPPLRRPRNSNCRPQQFSKFSSAGSRRLALRQVQLPRLGVIPTQRTTHASGWLMGAPLDQWEGPEGPSL